MWGNSLNLNPETDSVLPWAPFPEKFYTFRCRRRIAAYFAMQMKSKRSQIDNSMGTRPILYLQMAFETHIRLHRRKQYPILIILMVLVLLRLPEISSRSSSRQHSVKYILFKANSNTSIPMT
jgi:hypothetical protein